MNKRTKRILIGVGILFLLLKGMEWWVEFRFQKIINRKPDRAYDIQYKDFDVHSFFKGVTLEEVAIVPVAVDSGGTVIRGTVNYARLNGMKWYELVFAKRLDIEGIIFDHPMFKVTLSDNPKKKTSGKMDMYESEPNYNHYGQNYERRREDEDDKRSNFSRKSSKRGLKPPRKEIIGMNTFSNNSPRRYLHFFQHDENLLHYLDLEEGT